MAIVSWNKYYGETLKTTLERFRTEYPEYTDSKITYAGRLDPMAEGLVILLTDEDVHRKDEFIGLDKTYEVEFIVGVATDTYDILGKITHHRKGVVSDEEVEKGIMDLKMISSQEYPPYSSRTVNGKPLWQWHREGKMGEVMIPARAINISSVTYLSRREIPSLEFLEYVHASIDRVQGDFRQSEIKNTWDEYHLLDTDTSITVYVMRVHASSGTYMRGLVNTLGENLGVGATTVKITRTQIGSYH